MTSISKSQRAALEHVDLEYHPEDVNDFGTPDLKPRMVSLSKPKSKSKSNLTENERRRIKRLEQERNAIPEAGSW